MTQAETEKILMDFTKEVGDRALEIMGLAANKRYDEAAEYAILLADRAADIRNQFQMQKESADGDRYDLAALKVDASTITHSETAYERED